MVANTGFKTYGFSRVPVFFNFPVFVITSLLANDLLKLAYQLMTSLTFYFFIGAERKAFHSQEIKVMQNVKSAK